MNAPIELFHGFENVPNEWPKEEIKLARHKVLYYTFMYICVHLDVYICLHTCIYSVYVNMYIWIPVCICIYTYMNLSIFYVYIYIYERSKFFIRFNYFYFMYMYIFPVYIMCVTCMPGTCICHKRRPDPLELESWLGMIHHVVTVLWLLFLCDCVLDGAPSPPVYNGAFTLSQHPALHCFLLFSAL